MRYPNIFKPGNDFKRKIIVSLKSVDFRFSKWYFSEPPSNPQGAEEHELSFLWKRNPAVPENRKAGDVSEMRRKRALLSQLPVLRRIRASSVPGGTGRVRAGQIGGQFLRLFRAG
jgi:hypothetical protein